jgi:hypothetical protein
MSQQPIPVIALEYANPVGDGSPRWRRIVRVTHWAALAACAAATLIIGAVTTRYGVLIAVVIAPAGVLITVGAAINRDWRSLTLGVGHVGVCLLFVLLVNLLRWAPDTAHVPMTIMGTCYTLAASWLAVRWGVLWREARPQ